MGGRPDWRDLTHAEKAEIVRELAERGLSGSKIAGNFVGATRSAVLGFCRRNGIKLSGVPFHIAAPVSNPKRKPKKASPASAKRHREQASEREAEQAAVMTAPAPVADFPVPDPAALFAPEQPPEDVIAVLAGASAPLAYMAAVDARRCLWPLWDRFEGPFVSLCCGAERVAGRPYCKEHVSASTKP